LVSIKGNNVNNLKAQLAETAAKSRFSNTEKLCELLRKTAFDQALVGYNSLRYKYDTPIDSEKIKEYFNAQGVEVEIDPYYYVIKLSWQ
jgi:hypothetical protein